MNRPTLLASTLLTATLGFGAIGVAADDHEAMKETKDYKIIVKTSDGNAEDILKEIEAGMGTDGEMDVEVIMDGDGPMLPPMMAGHHRAIIAHHPGHMKSLSRDAANCIIKNIDNLRVESATHLLRSACAALHPAAE